MNYIVRFIRRDKRPNEEYYYNGIDEAEYHLNLFREDDSLLYERIELVSIVPKEKIIEAIRFS